MASGQEVMELAEVNPLAHGADQPLPLQCKDTASFLFNNLSANNHFVVYASRNSASVIKDKHEDLINNKSGIVRAAYKESIRISQAKFVKMSFADVLIIATFNGLLHVYDETGQKLLHFFKMDREVEMHGIASDGLNTLHIGLNTGELLIFTLTFNKIDLTRTITEHKAPIIDVTSSVAHLKYRNGHGNRMIASCDGHGSVIVFDADADYFIAYQINGNKVPITSIIICYDLLILGMATGHIQVHSIKKKTLMAEIAAHTRCITALAYNANRHMLASCSEDAFVHVWALPSAANSMKVEHVMSSQVKSCLLTGVQFCGNVRSLIIVSSYDCNWLHVIPMNVD